MYTAFRLNHRRGRASAYWASVEPPAQDCRFVAGERVVDSMTAPSDGEAAQKIHFRDSLWFEERLIVVRECSAVMDGLLGYEYELNQM